MSSLVHELLRTGLKDGDVGIEIETESINGYEVPAIPGWASKPDGSLRNFGIEYVSRGPVKIAEVGKHLSTWRKKLGDRWDLLDNTSHSTSVHVHVNIGDMTPIGLLNFFCLSLLFENVLCEFSGNDRKGNLFCLRTKDAEAKINEIFQRLRGVPTQYEIIRSLSPGNYKYSAINSDTIRQFNSLEFRMMRGEKDPDLIKKWVEVLFGIKQYSLKFECPKAILSLVKERGVMSLFTECFGEHAGDFTYPDIENDISGNLFYVASIASSRNFKELPIVHIKEKAKNYSVDFAALEQMAQMNQAARQAVQQQPQPEQLNLGFTEDFIEEDF